MTFYGDHPNNREKKMEQSIWNHEDLCQITAVGKVHALKSLIPNGGVV